MAFNMLFLIKKETAMGRRITGEESLELKCKRIGEVRGKHARENAHEDITVWERIPSAIRSDPRFTPDDQKKYEYIFDLAYQKAAYIQKNSDPNSYLGQIKEYAIMHSLKYGRLGNILRGTFPSKFQAMEEYRHASESQRQEYKNLYKNYCDFYYELALFDTTSEGKELIILEALAYGLGKQEKNSGRELIALTPTKIALEPSYADLKFNLKEKLLQIYLNPQQYMERPVEEHIIMLHMNNIKLSATEASDVPEPMISEAPPISFSTSLSSFFQPKNIFPPAYEEQGIPLGSTSSIKSIFPPENYAPTSEFLKSLTTTTTTSSSSQEEVFCDALSVRSSHELQKKLLIEKKQELRELFFNVETAKTNTLPWIRLLFRSLYLLKSFYTSSKRSQYNNIIDRLFDEVLTQFQPEEIELFFASTDTTEDFIRLNSRFLQLVNSVLGIDLPLTQRTCVPPETCETNTVQEKRKYEPPQPIPTSIFNDRWFHNERKRSKIEKEGSEQIIDSSFKG
jgi:hypothetical protein